MARLFLTVLLLGAPLVAQQEAAPRSNTVQVPLWVTVTDKKNGLVSGLPQEVFEVYEDGEPRTITSFSQGKTPVSIGILLDNSASMGRKLGKRSRGGHVLPGSSDLTRFVRRVLSDFLAYFPEPEHEFFLVVFGEKLETVTDFTSDRDTILNAVQSPSPHGQTALYDALMLGFRKMEAAANTRKALLLVSDGHDNRSKSEKSEIMGRVRQSQVSIYPVGIFGLIEPRRTARIPEFEADSWLSKVARESGGRYFPVITQDGFLTTADQIGRGLAEQYCLKYDGAPSAGNSRRKVEVRIDLGEHRKQVRSMGAKLPLRVHTKAGYYHTPSGDNSP